MVSAPVERDPLEIDDAPAPEDVPSVRCRPPVPMPSEKVRFEHSLTHIPFQPWCEICVSARGRGDPLRPAVGPSTLIPLVAFDFAFFREGRGMINVPVLVMSDKDSGCVGALALPSKSTFHPG